MVISDLDAALDKSQKRAAVVGAVLLGHMKQPPASRPADCSSRRDPPTHRDEPALLHPGVGGHLVPTIASVGARGIRLAIASAKRTLAKPHGLPRTSKQTHAEPSRHSFWIHPGPAANLALEPDIQLLL
jgi:hypothetical protein